MKSGKWRRYKVTTRQIIQKLRAGKMPAHVEAAQAGGDFKPLTYFPEFQDSAPARKSSPLLLPSIKASLSDSRLSSAPRRNLYVWLIGALFALGLLFGGLLVLFLIR